MRTSAFTIALAALCPAVSTAVDLIRRRTSNLKHVSAPAAGRRTFADENESFRRQLANTAESLSFSMAVDIEQLDISLSMLLLEPADMSMELPSVFESLSMSMPETAPLPPPGPPAKPEEPQIDVLPEGPARGPPGPPDALVSSGVMVGTTVSALVAAGAIMLL